MKHSNSRCIYIMLHSDIEHVTSCNVTDQIALRIVQLVHSCIEFTVNAEYVENAQYVQYVLSVQYVQKVQYAQYIQ